MLKNQDPLVSVVMPSYNSKKFISRAIESILNQTFVRFELIIINDCSTDDSLKIIQSYAKKDKRIRIISNRKRLNIAGALNKGIRSAKTDLIARMDADDISNPDRLLLQYKLISSSNRIAAVGANIIIMDCNEHETAIRRYPVSSKEMKRCLFRYSPFAHPVVMFKKHIFEEIGGYNRKYSPTEDLDLWFRMGVKYEFGSIPEALLRYRVYEKSSSNQSLKNLEKLVFKIRWNALTMYGYRPSLYDVIYNVGQLLTLYITPTKWRISIYNLLRNNNVI